MKVDTHLAIHKALTPRFVSVEEIKGLRSRNKAKEENPQAWPLLHIPAAKYLTQGLLRTLAL